MAVPGDWRNIHEKRGELRQWADSSAVTASALNTSLTITSGNATSATVVPSGIWFDNTGTIAMQSINYPTAFLVSDYSYKAEPDLYAKDESPLEWLKRRVEEMRINLIPELAMA